MTHNTNRVTEPIRFAVEEDDSRERYYKTLHLAGCSDLRDPETFAASSVDELVDNLSGLAVMFPDEPLDVIKHDIMPCCRKQIAALRNA